LNRQKHVTVPGAGRATALAVAVAAAGLMVSGGSASASARGLPPPAAPGRPAASARLARQPFLITGDRVLARPAGTGAGGILPAAGTVPSGGIIALSVGGSSYDVPQALLPDLGHGLDPSLFEPQLLLAAERGGRLAVRIGYRGRLPSLPGVTITRSGGGTALGYLTDSSARTFGSALSRQQPAGHARPDGKAGGLLAGGTTIGLAAAPSAAPAVSPDSPMHTVTVKATSLSGRPDTGGTIQVFNVTNTRLGFQTGTFYHGQTRFSLPAGRYFALATFSPASGASARLVVKPQFTVTGNRTLAVHETSASSKVTVVTPRRAAPADTDLYLRRTGASGPLVLLEALYPGGQVWVSPTHVKPSVGTLRTAVNQHLESPSGARTPYEYTVSFTGPPGLIPAERHVLHQRDLATIHEHFYQSASTTGWWSFGGSISGTNANASDNHDWFGLIEPAGPNLTLPGRLTEYAGGTGTARMEWGGGYSAGPGAMETGETSRLLHPGEQLTDNWAADPLHPGADELLTTLPNMFWQGGASLPTAVRTGNTLQLQLDPFDDSAPGHETGAVQAQPGPDQATGTYRISQNGRTVASGDAVAAASIGLFYAKTTLSPKASTVRFALRYARGAKNTTLPAATSTVWAWRSAPKPGARLPRGWTCVRFYYGHRACAAQPMLTLGYSVARLNQRELAPAGQQAVRLTVGHIQPATGSRITRAAVSVSLDGGRTWQAARISGRDGSYTATFAAPAGATVSLRTAAADAAGGTVTETITGAYQTTS
jgi:hypothetical protein